MVLVNKVTKSTATKLSLINKFSTTTITKASLINSAIALNKEKLVGIDAATREEQFPEQVSHFLEMKKIQEMPSNDYIYLPITNHIRKLLDNPSGGKSGYKESLHDGLVYGS